MFITWICNESTPITLTKQRRANPRQEQEERRVDKKKQVEKARNVVVDGDGLVL